ncbi:MAG: flagellar filament capping protein FliD, partial [Phycisphaerales bacterium]
DSTVNNIRSRLLSAVQGRGVGVTSEFEFLFQAGIKIGSGAKLEFDRDRFREALEADPEGIEQLFAASRLAPRNPIEIAPGVTVNNTGRDTYTELGVPGVIADLVKSFTDSVDGLLTTKSKSIDSAIDLQEGRIDQYDAILASKRARLEAQFLAMEKAIAQLQTQSSALTNFGG